MLVSEWYVKYQKCASSHESEYRKCVKHAKSALIFAYFDKKYYLCTVLNTYDYGDMWEQYYDSIARNFAAMMKFLYRHKLIDRSQPNLNNILRYTEHCGWGFEDDIKYIYYEYTH